MSRMSRVTLLDWDATRAEGRAGLLRRAGHETASLAPRRGAELHDLARDPPDAFVIDLDRVPWRGRDIGLWLHQRKATRHVPIVFVGGAPDKVARVRQVWPEAIFTPWSRIRSALRRAMAQTPAAPAVRGAMAGYSGTPLPKKLGIKPGSTVALLGAPSAFERTLGRLPEEVRLRRQARGRADLILLFAKSRADLKQRFPAATRCLNERGGLWILWPKKASGVPTDLTQKQVRAFGLDRHYVDYKICAVDQTWSGLLFARRKQAGAGK